MSLNIEKTIDFSMWIWYNINVICKKRMTYVILNFVGKASAVLSRVAEGQAL